MEGQAAAVGRGCLSVRLGGERIFVFGWVVGRGGVFSQG